jgi:chromosome segregation ATPase
LRNQLEKKKAEIVDLNNKKNKYKKHAKAADQKLKDLKKKVESTEGSDDRRSSTTNVNGGDSEVEELRAAKSRLEKKLKASKQDYDELEKEVLALEEENSQLEEELGKKKKERLNK